MLFIVLLMVNSLLGKEEASIAVGECHKQQGFGASHTHMQEGIIDGFGNVFGPVALQGVKQKAEMCLFKVHLLGTGKVMVPTLVRVS